MGSLRGLPSEYEVLKQSLSLAASLTLADLRQAFSSKDTEENDSTPTALYTAARPVIHVSAASPTSTGQKFCIVHKTASHNTDECNAIKELFKEQQNNRKQQRSRNNNGKCAGHTAIRLWNCLSVLMLSFKPNSALTVRFVI